MKSEVCLATEISTPERVKESSRNYHTTLADTLDANSSLAAVFAGLIGSGDKSSLSPKRGMKSD